ncbi:Acyl-CoA wax alcohol acyltransferase 1 [Cricetulus griseus]|uniref:Acyl-CoA wax alcohol acyltransferase 1 n=1 Tax=Cricetulus griseus TaxID=10029 RepID=G3I1F6_CRIGR|nr:Acyl-CoA wax alcohol acyltransferase 1 [Cricetulus griseus]
MPCSKKTDYLQSLSLLQWPLGYLAIFFILQPLFIGLLFTSLWLLPTLYFVWLFLDWKTPNQGVCSVSQPAINYLLSHGTGNLLGIVVGGVGEALQSVPNTTTLILQKRKGFVRTALQHGAHLVPTFTFGETEVYDQVLFHEDSRMYKFQSFFRWIFGFYFCVFYGQGFCQDSVGLLPYHKPIVTIVGEPLPLPRVESPSPEMVDKYHELYMDALYKLFEQHKVQHGYSKTQKLLFL